MQHCSRILLQVLLDVNANLDSAHLWSVLHTCCNRGVKNLRGCHTE